MSIKKDEILKRFFPSSKNLTIPVNAQYIFEITSEMDSTIHFDDQVEIFQVGDHLAGTIIADGVSQSSGGRIVATSLCELIPQSISDKYRENGTEFIQNLDDACVDVIHSAIQKLKTQISYESLKQWTANQGQKPIVDAMRAIEDGGKFKSTLPKLIGDLKKLKDKHDNFIDQFKSMLKSFQERGYTVSEYEQAKQSLEAQKEVLKSFLEMIKGDFEQLDGMVQEIQVVKDLEQFVKENIERTRVMVSLVLESITQKIDIIDGQRTKYDALDFEKFDSIANDKLDEFKDMLKKIAEEGGKLEPLVTSKFPDWIQVILKHFDRTKENLLKLFGDLFKRLKTLQNTSADSTLALVLFELPVAVQARDPEQVRIKVHSFVLGDPEIFLLLKEDIWMTHYQVSQGTLKSFVSSEIGIGGKLDVCSRFLYPEDTVIVASDGANIAWTTPGGYAYTPFQKLLKDEIRAKDSIKDIPSTWYNKLKEKNAITDDFSLVLGRIKRNGR